MTREPAWTYGVNTIFGTEIWGWNHGYTAYVIEHWPGAPSAREWSASVKDLLTGRLTVFDDVFVGLAAGKALCAAKHKASMS